MNQQAKRIFDVIAGRCAGLCNDISEVFDKYAQMEKLANTESKKYKDETAVYQQRHIENVASAREEYKNCADVFAAKIRDDAEALRQELLTALGQRVNPALVERCRVLKEFGIAPTRSEIEQFLAINGENLTGLRMISNLLQSTKSNYSVDFKKPEAFESDITLIKNLASLADGFTPNGCHTEAVAVLTGQQIAGKPLGAVWDRTSLLVRRAEFNSTVNKITALADSWISGVTFSLRESEVVENEDPDDDTEPVAPPSSTTITERNDTGAAAMEYAGNLGKARAEADRTAAETIARYAR